MTGDLPGQAGQLAPTAPGRRTGTACPSRRVIGLMLLAAAALSGLHDVMHVAWHPASFR